LEEPATFIFKVDYLYALEAEGSRLIRNVGIFLLEYASCNFRMLYIHRQENLKRVVVSARPM
jgi:hypothetical protein